MPSTTLKEPKSIQFVQRKLNQAHAHELSPKNNEAEKAMGGSREQVM